MHRCSELGVIELAKDPNIGANNGCVQRSRGSEFGSCECIGVHSCMEAANYREPGCATVHFLCSESMN